jgi:hypothetical protein
MIMSSIACHQAIPRVGLSLFAAMSILALISPSYSQTLDEQERCTKRAKIVLEEHRKGIDGFLSEMTKSMPDFRVSSRLYLDMAHYNTKLRKCLMLTVEDVRTPGEAVTSHEVEYLLRDAYEDRSYAEASKKFQSASDDAEDKPIKPPVVEGWVSMRLGEHTNKQYKDITAFYREIEPLLTE